ncbi:AI-2E family transporter [Priestia megaterium]|uniref:AI-2E family transporter n=1 Tax=Priestia megaterium TaxID=1404 RepID=UPI001C239258|nr:AI-2E family transporter [Priestia megaterium]MBU8689026.1 AI-2E family transporter [Priestia megaterium]
MFKSKLHFWTLELLMIALLIYICKHISFVFLPIGVFISTLFFPILVAGFLFFLFEPIVSFLTRKKVPKTLAILLLYVVFIGIIASIVGGIGPTLSKQLTDLAKNIPSYIVETREYINDLSNSRWFNWLVEQKYVSLDHIEESLLNYASTLPTNLTNSISSVLSVVTNITLTVVTVPFILFYMLKDSHKLRKNTLRMVPASYRKETLRTMKETTNTLATYIQGQMLVCLFVGISTFIGYLIIGLPYALILALIGALTNIIPYVGPFIGVAPALIVGLLYSPTKAILVIIVVVIVQQLDGNIISPLVIGKKLNTHPLTIIILLLVAGNIAGILGMILAIPAYAVTKTIVINIVRMIQFRNKSIKL